MKRLLWGTILVLGLVLTLGAQTTSDALATTQTPAPLPDEKTLTISDAATGTSAQPQGAPADVSVWDFVKMFLVLALVIGMIVAFVWFMRRLSGQNTEQDSPIKVLQTQTLGGSRSLQVVDVAGEVFLLGVGDGSVSLLKDLTGTEAADSFRLAASQKKANAKGFGELLGGFLGIRPKIRPNVEEPVENSSDFLKKQRERLKKL